MTPDEPGAIGDQVTGSESTPDASLYPGPWEWLDKWTLHDLPDGSKAWRRVRPSLHRTHHSDR